MPGATELQRVLADLRGTVSALTRGYRDQGRPVTDGSPELLALCARLEFLLQFDLKEKRSLWGQRQDYWDFLCQGLRGRHEHQGITHVRHLPQLRTPLGRGRALLRYCLARRQLAETLQLCLLDPQATRAWYHARSPFLDPQLCADLLACLYDLDGVAFCLDPQPPGLDAGWPPSTARCQQDVQRLAQAEHEALAREQAAREELGRQREVEREVKGRLLELLREKDSLWQQSEGIGAPPAPGPCARCRSTAGPLARRHQCR
ncbi:RUN and FYVE domain-containing protein 4 [Alligator mississippiensis]|uniref:RUN and FYVE domain-containing protein 4 n=1 Tax=Alligator mississippiensis TaxID=8496 RepID=A0A151P2U2_ALLMI|nr:RUN and FYVE domain-containing protein 4 [Alligator mississippiensis]